MSKWLRMKTFQAHVAHSTPGPTSNTQNPTHSLHTNAIACSPIPLRCTLRVHPTGRHMSARGNDAEHVPVFKIFFICQSVGADIVGPTPGGTSQLRATTSIHHRPRAEARRLWNVPYTNATRVAMPPQRRRSPRPALPWKPRRGTPTRFGIQSPRRIEGSYSSQGHKDRSGTLAMKPRRLHRVKASHLSRLLGLHSQSSMTTRGWTANGLAHGLAIHLNAEGGRSKGQRDQRKRASISEWVAAPDAKAGFTAE